MKSISTTIILLFLLLPFNSFCHGGIVGHGITMNDKALEGVIVEGIIRDTVEEYVMLSYVPRMRGNLNFDNFRSIGAEINEEGEFRIASDNITPAGNFGLVFPTNYIPLKLFSGDSIHLEVYLTNPELTFATGKGAGKINVLSLPQFQYGFFDLDKVRGLNEFGNYIDSIIDYQLNLLEEIYSKKIDSDLIVEAQNTDQLKNIILDSPISLEGYKLLKNLAKFRRYGLVSSFLAKQSSNFYLEFGSIDFNSAVFRDFNKSEYGQLENINDAFVHNDVEAIIHIEYLKEKNKDEDIDITYGNYRSFLSGKKFHDWIPQFLKDNFKKDIFNKYYGEHTAGMMTWGMDYETSLSKLNLKENNKYVKRIKGFKQLLTNGINNEDYGLYENSKRLNEKKFKDLLSAHKESPMLMIFWSGWAAGASLIDNLPSLRLFEEDYKDKVDVVYICVDKDSNKNLWAARVVDESWKAKHYFMPIEENETTLKGISDKDISSLCNGGANYIFIDKNGEIKQDVGAPFYMKRKDKKELYK